MSADMGGGRTLAAIVGPGNIGTDLLAIIDVALQLAGERDLAATGAR